MTGPKQTKLVVSGGGQRWVVSAAEAFRRSLAQQDDITVFALMRPGG